MTYSFTVAGTEPVDLEDIANQLRQEIDNIVKVAPDSPPDKLLAAKCLNHQTGVQTYLSVVRGNEDPHTHPDGDLIVSVLEGGGYFQLVTGKVEAPEGSVVVIPKGVCHAFFHQTGTDSVILATFSPINSKGDCPLIA